MKKTINQKTAEKVLFTTYDNFFLIIKKNGEKVAVPADEHPELWETAEEVYSFWWEV